MVNSVLKMNLKTIIIPIFSSHFFKSIPVFFLELALRHEVTNLSCTEVQSDHTDNTDITNESFGNDDKGLDFSETEVSPYHLDHETSKTSIGDDGPLLQAKRNNEKTLVISDDPESAPLVTPAPKTVRAWLREPRLYVVMIVSSRIALSVWLFVCSLLCFLLLSFFSLFFESYKPLVILAIFSIYFSRMV